jgi:signal transduction histidine kinase
MGFQSVQMIPIECEGRMLGAFAVGYKGEHEFNAAQSRAAATVASQVAFAIERRRTGEALEALVNERTASLRSAIEQMEEFSYTVSHDLRAPLRGMEAYGSALIEDFGTELPPEALRYARKITENAHRLDRMILDVLTFSRLARSELQIAPVSLDRLVRDIVDHHPAMQPPAANVQVATLGSVKAHEPSLSQALSNLLANAVKFVPAGVQPIVKIWSERRDRNTRLWVEDNGIGIDPRYQHRLFSMFERIHSNLSYDGTGVGLAIVRKAMDRMGGACGVESDGKNGSRFWIEMPAAD